MFKIDIKKHIKDEELLSFLHERWLNLKVSFGFGVLTAILVMIFSKADEVLAYLEAAFDAAPITLKTFNIPVGAFLAMVVYYTAMSYRRKDDVNDKTRSEGLKAPMILWDGFVFAIFSVFTLAAVLVIFENEHTAGFWAAYGITMMIAIGMYVFAAPAVVYGLIKKNIYIEYLAAVVIVYVLINSWLLYAASRPLAGTAL
ncbi:hypothetical protein GCM10011402_31870 [Paracoccus acridae]|uniref:Uncharacterized protein n=1 Tax=Paracoccus acridae TaxID=1795310 RepID=A0ABQ1VL89_9RHOB|nr:hypothetical protein [Paracoccus acridae]GGF76735.1 hypothetical protein GCM10011402_31870 [Paracoccus acridae]